MACTAVDATAHEREVVTRCLQGEEVPMDVQGVRERALCVAKLPLVVKDGDEISAELCASWLIGAFQISFSLSLG
jgi:U3 small nucleolar RNA-associated protein 20